MHRLINYKNRRGLTLIEVLFVAASMGLLLTALTLTTMGGIRSYQRGVELSNMKEQLRRAIDELSTDVRQANPVGGTGGWVTPAYSDGALNPTQTLSFNRFVADTANPETAMPETQLITYTIATDPDNSSYSLLERSQGTSLRYLSRYLLVDTNPAPGGGQIGSHFRWAQSGMDTSRADYNTLIVKLVMEKYLPVFLSEQRLERMVVETAVNIRSDITPSAGSDYGDNLTSMGTFMQAPSSLIPPFDEKP